MILFTPPQKRLINLLLTEFIGSSNINEKDAKNLMKIFKEYKYNIKICSECHRETKNLYRKKCGTCYKRWYLKADRSEIKTIKWEKDPVSVEYKPFEIR